MADYHCPDAKTVQELKDVANKLRIHSITATQASNSGHPTSCASIAEIMSVLFFDTMRYSVKEPKAANSDRFVLSKGHAAPILYAAWVEAGLIPESELKNLRKIDNDLEGHPTPRLSFVDVATGSLGQGLSVAAGMAYVGKYFDKADYRTYCVVGDGESAEGSIWEALHFASHYKLDNLCAIFDINRLGQSEATSLGHDMEVYRARLEAFGWNTYVVNGHDIGDLTKAFHQGSTTKGKPTALLAQTYKGKGFEGIEDKDNWHGKPLGTKAEDIIAQLNAGMMNGSGGDAPAKRSICPKMPKTVVEKNNIKNVKLSEEPNYTLGQKIATRKAYGDALVKLSKNNEHVIAMDGDTKNSTFSQALKDVFPERYVECFIAEQNLVGVAIGAACRDRKIVFASTFAAFFSRAYDQIRMGAISQTNINLAGSHCGVSIGEDGPSQMALEDLAMFRAIPTATVFYPSDAVSMERAAELAANTPGICFIRTSRPATKVLYKNDEVFTVGKAKVIRQSDSDVVTVVASCITLYEAVKAADLLAESGINIRLIDPFTIKPIDAETIIKAAKATNGKVITVEDHYAEGGIGEAVCGALSEERDVIVRRLAVTGVPRSGKCDELLAMFNIDAAAICRTVKELMKA